jgi:hypothetical protein
MDPQRLVQHPVERGAVAAELLPQLLLLLGVGKVGGGASTRSCPCPELIAGLLEAGGPARGEEASTTYLEHPATMRPSHLLTSTPSWDSGVDVGGLAH